MLRRLIFCYRKIRKIYQILSISISGLLLSIAVFDYVRAQTIEQDRTIAEQQGTQLGEDFYNRYITNDVLVNELVNPLISGKPMRTLDNQSTFSAQMICKSQTDFLKISLALVENGEATINISQNLDLSGEYDYSIMIPRFSGVCSNGFIVCRSGTWLECLGYKWVSNENGSINYVPYSISELSGCFCTNSSCGSNLVYNNAAEVLSTLGIGIVREIQNKIPTLGIVTAELNKQSLEIKYIGEQTRDCSQATADAPDAGLPSNYYDSQSDSQIVNKGNETLDSLPELPTNDPNELMKIDIDERAFYKDVAKGRIGQRNVTENTCRIYRNISVETLTVTENDTIDDEFTVWVGVENLYGELYRQNNNVLFDLVKKNLLDNETYRKNVLTYTIQDGEPTSAKINLSVSAAPAICAYSGEGCNNLSFDSHCFLKVTYNNQVITLPPGGSYASQDGQCSVTNQSLFTGCYIDAFTPLTYNWRSLDVSGTIDATRKIAYCGVQNMLAGNIFVRLSYEITYKTDNIKEEETDNCKLYEDDPNCRLDSERVDGVLTIKNGSSTGLQPLPSCKTFRSSIKEYNVCKDWWVKERKYFCKTTTEYGLDEDTKKRIQQVHTTSQRSGTQMSYQDSYARDLSGNPISYDTTGYIPEEKDTDSCIKACKVYTTGVNTNANAFGNVTQYQVNPTEMNYEYRKCIKSGSVYTCPKTPEESISINCQCINEFGMAVTVLEIINEAAKGAICSSGQKH